MFRYLLLWLLTFVAAVTASAQADNEIQVYASPTVGAGKTMVELHSNYTIRGNENLTDEKSARWTNETVEITHGFGDNFEIGFYTFTAISPDGKYEYLGNQIRPRITVPESWGWKVGASVSAELGFFRPDVNSDFEIQGELRPIVDKTTGNFYIAFNPNLEFELSGDTKQVRITPQVKTVYTLAGKVGVGLEYYSNVGTFTRIDSGPDQEHLLGPAIDLYLNEDWEFNAGFLFGLTPGSNQDIVKILIGKRFGK